MVSSNESVGYHIAKAGIEHLARYFASEFGVHGIRVNAISPGWLVKDQHKEFFYSEENSNYRHSVELTHLLNPIGSIEDIVDAMLFLGSKRSKFITGQTINVDGGLGIKEPGSMLLGKNRHATK
jgi:NAD(P)-dependent dehydrogenase (short-subunit alcohol dehydrogenase family)